MTRLLATIATVLLAVAPAAAQQADTSGEVLIELESFGVGGLARPGDWAALRLNITDRGDQPREVMVRVTLTDADGDHPTPTRVVATNPGVTQGQWLYVHLPPREASEPIEIGVNLALQQEDGAYRPGRLLGSTVVNPTGRVLPMSAGMMLVLGSRLMELNQYEVTYQQQPNPPGAHERLFVTKDLEPADLPDRWVGLAPFEAIVWAEGDPIDLSSERAEALREWVTRGGHLVIILPPVGQTWLTNRNPLVDILPRVTVTRHDGVSLEPYRALLTDRPFDAAILPDNATVHTLQPRDDAAPAEATSILAGRDGDPVVVRRLVGVGAVTLVGIDVNAPAFARTASIDPDVFWHRVLGRRGDLLSQLEVQRLATTPGPERLMVPQRPVVPFDGALENEIAKTGRAAAGVLLGFVVFVLFWVVAGPGGFALLKTTGRVRHAWLAYAGATALFTIIAWGGATLIRPARVDASYLRILDHVYAQPVQRARVWASVLIPSYGEATIGVGDPESRFHNTIIPWRSPSPDATLGGFPDARAYPLYAADLRSMTVPTRATVKQVMADWAGDPAWRMPLPVPADGQEVGEIRLLSAQEMARAVVPDGYRKPMLAGTLVHELPAPLEDVTIIVVRGLRDLPAPRTSLTRLPGGPLVAEAFAYKRSGPWDPGQDLDLAGATTVPLQLNNSLHDVSAEALLADLAPKSTNVGLAPNPTDVALRVRLDALSLYSMLEPPDPATRDATPAPIVTRQQTHAWDLGRWFTQPCVIIIGHIPDLKDPQETPAQLYVDGRPAPMRGRTVVRWVYPLPADPPGHPAIDPDQPPAFSPIPGDGG